MRGNGRPKRARMVANDCLNHIAIALPIQSTWNFYNVENEVEKHAIFKPNKWLCFVSNF